MHEYSPQTVNDESLSLEGVFHSVHIFDSLAKVHY